MNDAVLAAIAFVHVVAHQERADASDVNVYARLNALIELARDLEQDVPPLPPSLEAARHGR